MTKTEAKASIVLAALLAVIWLSGPGGLQSIIDTLMPGLQR